MNWVDANNPSVSMPNTPAIAMNTIIVRIGFKPSPYFRDAVFGANPMYSYGDHLLEIRRLTAEMREQKKQIEDAIAEQKPQILKQNEESERLFEDAMKRLDELRNRPIPR
jgi:hypothetical protein